MNTRKEKILFQKITYFYVGLSLLYTVAWEAIIKYQYYFYSSLNGILNYSSLNEILNLGLSILSWPILSVLTYLLVKWLEQTKLTNNKWIIISIFALFGVTVLPLTTYFIHRFVDLLGQGYDFLPPKVYLVTYYKGFTSHSYSVLLIKWLFSIFVYPFGLWYILYEFRDKNLSDIFNRQVIETEKR